VVRTWTISDQSGGSVRVVTVHGGNAPWLNSLEAASLIADKAETHR
jgi:hypothetical protein